MGARRVQYQIVGRYMKGKEVTGYHLQSLETGKQGKYSKEAVAYLVGRDQITNCKAQIYNNELLLRGEGISLESLPVQYEDGSAKNLSGLGHIRRGTEASEAMTQVMVVGICKAHKTYIVSNVAGAKMEINKAQLIDLAQQGKVGNARVQMYQGKTLLRGINCDFRNLPDMQINA